MGAWQARADCVCITLCCIHLVWVLIINLSGDMLTLNVLHKTVRVLFCDGPIITSLIHNFPVYAKPHASSKNHIMMMCAGHFARSGSGRGKASLGKAKKVNQKGCKPASKHPGVFLDCPTGTWRARSRVEAAKNKADLVTGLQRWQGRLSSRPCHL
jgi:hypothetical protein